MSDPLIIQTLKQKRAEISGVIAAYQAKIAQARHDLAHINAVIRLVEGDEQERAQYIVSHGFFKKGEIADVCLARRLSVRFWRRRRSTRSAVRLAGRT